MIEIWENDTVLQKQLKKRLNARRWTHNDLAEAAEMPITTVRDIVHRGREPYAYNRNGDVHKEQSINRAIKRIVEKYNCEAASRAGQEGVEPVPVPKFSCHIARRSFATRMVELKADPKWLQTVMGHDDIRTTMNLYAEAQDDFLHSEAERIDELIKWG